MRPRRGIRNRVALHFFERGRAWLRDDQLAVRRREEQEIAGADDRRVFGFASLAQPQRLAGRGIDREELAAILVRQAEDRRAAHGRRAHIHRHLLVAPRGVALHPFPDRRGSSSAIVGIVEAGVMQQVVDDERSDGVLFVWRLDRHFPQQLAVGRRDADELVLRLRDDLPHAAERRQDRRRVRWTIAGPSPLHGAGRGIHRGQRAGVHAAEKRDHARAVDDRRSRGAEFGRAGGASLLHSSLPVARSCAEKMPVMPSVNTRPPETSGVDFGPGRDRSPPGSSCKAHPRRPATVAFRTPDRSRQHLAIALARVDDQASAGDHRRGMTDADGSLPFLRELRRPRRRRRER